MRFKNMKYLYIHSENHHGLMIALPGCKNITQFLRTGNYKAKIHGTRKYNAYISAAHLGSTNRIQRIYFNLVLEKISC